MLRRPMPVRLYMFLIIAHLKRMIPVFSSLMYCACILTGICSLKLLNPDGTDVIPGFTKDLINAIMSSPAYHTQEDLDREDTYLIELVLSKDGVIISLRVNGWETVSTTPEV